jgi:hypothetical protein
MDAKKKRQIEEKLRRLIEAEDRNPSDPQPGVGPSSRPVQVIRRRPRRPSNQVANELS